MKKNIILFISLFLSISSFAQYKTFKNSTGTVFEIMEFEKMYPIDSCVNIAKLNSGWSLPDTSQLRSISEQWFGKEHTHLYYIKTSQEPRSTQDMSGFCFLSSNKYQGDNFIEVEMRNPIRKIVSSGWNINEPDYFNLLLIRPKK